LDKDSFDEIEKLGEKVAIFSIISIISSIYAADFSAAPGALFGFPASLLPKFSFLFYLFSSYFLVYFFVKLDFLKSSARAERGEQHLSHLLELEPPAAGANENFPDGFGEILEAVQRDLIASQKNSRPSRKRFGYFVIYVPCVLWSVAGLYLFFSAFPAGR
jgi:hypothetical protein